MTNIRILWLRARENIIIDLTNSIAFLAAAESLWYIKIGKNRYVDIYSYIHIYMNRMKLYTQFIDGALFVCIKLLIIGRVSLPNWELGIKSTAYSLSVLFVVRFCPFWHVDDGSWILEMAAKENLLISKQNNWKQVQSPA